MSTGYDDPLSATERRRAVPRGKQARNEGISSLRELQETLTAVDQRLRRAQPA
jgi:hypothetical protein